MPRIKIDVNEGWLRRTQQVIPAAIDALDGLAHRIAQHQDASLWDAEDLLDELKRQLIDVRRDLQAIRIIF